MQLLKDGNTVESLDYVQATKLGLNGNLFTASELPRNRRLAAEEGFTGLHMAIGRSRYRRDPLEVLDIRGNDDVYVLGSADYPPGVDGQPTDQYELDACLR